MSEYAWNYQTDMSFITERTVHKVRDREGRRVTAQCGASFHTEVRNVGDLDDLETPERHKCGRCWRGETDE